MPTELKIPHAGESITEVFILEWTKAIGDWADQGETVAIIETDKANMDLGAPIAGNLTQVLKNAGDAAAPDEVVGYMEAAARPEGEDPPAPAAAAPPPAEPAPALAQPAQTYV